MFERMGRRTACKQYEARWENYLEGTADSNSVEELTAHLERCAGCREALEAARLGRELLSQNLSPAPEPGVAFAARVVASIRAQQNWRLAAGDFWRPLEVLAARLVWTATVALLVLAAYLVGVAPRQNRGQVSSHTEVSEGFPEPAQQPADKDEVLLTLAEDGYGR